MTSKLFLRKSHCLLLSFLLSSQCLKAETLPSADFPAILTPPPKADISPDQQVALEKQLAEVTADFQAIKKHPRAADVDIFLKAIRYAIDFHEWYDKKPEDGVKKAIRMLTEASTRIASLKKNETPWLDKPGRTVLGFYSDIDGSPQPYGVEIPEGLKWGEDQKQVPIWVWLHGRGDTQTDLHYIASQLNGKAGDFKTQQAIIIHPFGRYCNGFKSAGETDVLEARNDALKRFNGDRNKVALMGFSMGGAGAWHMGAHYADQWAVVHTGAGFVDVKRYQKLTPEKMPVWYEQKMWGVYDVPNYARNFYNVPLISYSGETDSQRDSGEYMTEVLAKEGITRPHLIGPKVGHKYEPTVLTELTGMMEKAVAKGRDPQPKKVWLQTRSARYSRMHWLELLQVQTPWEDTRLEAEMVGDNELRITTKNVIAFKVDQLVVKLDQRKVFIDGHDLGVHVSIKPSDPFNTFVFFEGKWIRQNESSLRNQLSKAGGTTLEDAFLRDFVVVLPEGKGYHPETDAWVEAESRHFIQRWRRLMRGDPKIMTVAEVLKNDLINRNLILWGDAKSNPLIARALQKIPVQWDADKVQVGAAKADASKHVLCVQYPRNDYRTLQSYRVVINSGLTFREAHDRTNSLQNPKLPDWAILDITKPRNGERAGDVVAADFFDVHWKVSEAIPSVEKK